MVCVELPSQLRIPDGNQLNMNKPISIKLKDADHLIVQIGDEVRTGNLYYLGIDRAGNENEYNPVLGVQRLIDGWIQTIMESTDNRMFYLPFDFSDEFTRWVACQRNGPNIDCVFGWVAFEGWSISPSDFREHAFNLKGFQPDDPVHVQTNYCPALLSGLRSSRSKLIDPTA